MRKAAFLKPYILTGCHRDRSIRRSHPSEESAPCLDTFVSQIEDVYDLLRACHGPDQLAPFSITFLAVNCWSRSPAALSARQARRQRRFLMGQKRGRQGHDPQWTALHRAQFVDWRPTAAVTAAVTADGTALAVARDSGRIEVWDTDCWALLTVRSHMPSAALRVC